MGRAPPSQCGGRFGLPPAFPLPRPLLYPPPPPSLEPLAGREGFRILLLSEGKTHRETRYDAADSHLPSTHPFCSGDPGNILGWAFYTLRGTLFRGTFNFGGKSNFFRFPLQTSAAFNNQIPFHIKSLL